MFLQQSTFNLNYSMHYSMKKFKKIINYYIFSVESVDVYLSSREDSNFQLLETTLEVKKKSWNIQRLNLSMNFLFDTRSDVYS